MPEVFLDLVAFALIALAAVACYVLGRFLGPTLRRPRIDALVATTTLIATVTAGILCGMLLGLASVWRNLTGQVLIPPALGLLLIVAAVALPATGLVNILRNLRRWDSMPHALHVHSRATDHAAHLHRRATDVPEEPKTP
jgi:hypothetical protein